MPIKIEITGENAEHALAELRGLSSGMTPHTLVLPGEVVRGEMRADPEVAEALAAPNGPVTVPVEEPAPKRRGRPRKAEAQAPAVVAADEPVAEPDEDEDEAVGAVEEDSPEVRQQDAEDEAKPADAPLTSDDLRRAMKGYVDAYGMAAAQEDGPRILALVLAGDLDALHAEGRAFRLSDVAPERLAHAIKEFKMAVTNNPFNREQQKEA